MSTSSEESVVSSSEAARTCVLLIDDQRIIGEALRRVLATQPDIEFHFCSDPAVALQTAKEVNPTVILQDLVMPGKDGLDLVEEFRATPATAEIPIVVLSSKEEAVTKADCFARGANDYLVKLPDPVEIIARLRYHSKGYQALLERNAAYAKLADELAQAGAYVQRLLPAPLEHSAVRTRWLFCPSIALGGDNFGYRWIDDDHFTAWIVDVCGHGVGPALLSVMIRNTLETGGVDSSVDYRKPARVLERLNDIYQMSDHGGMFFTAWYGVYQLSTRQLTWAGGGHPPAKLICADGVVESLASQNLPVGVAPGIPHDESSVAVPKGAALYLYSDGIFEIKLGDGTIWPFNDFEALIGERSVPGGDRIARLVDYTKKLQGSETYADDVSIVEVRFS